MTNFAVRAAFGRSLVEWSDIQGHVQRLHDLVIELDAKSVLELGVRDAVSTSAFLAALEQTDGQLYSVDINVPQHKINEYNDPRWSFFQGFSTGPLSNPAFSDLPARFDVVFVDTDHIYELTKQEIVAWSPRIRSGGLMVFHDTNLERFEHHTTWQPPFPVRAAIEEWLDVDDDAVLEESYSEFYGLMVVRIS